MGGEQTDAFMLHPGDMHVPETANSADWFAILEEAGVGAFVGGIGSFFHVIWTPEEVRDYRTVATGDRVLNRYFSLDLMNRGVFLLGHPNVSAVTTDEDLSFTLDVVRRSVDELKPLIRERAPRFLTK